MKDPIKAWREQDFPDVSHLRPVMPNKFYDADRTEPNIFPPEEPWLLGLIPLAWVTAPFRAAGATMGKLVSSVTHPRRPGVRPRHGK